MPRSSFLIWNALAAIVSSLVTVFGAYAIATSVLGQLSARSALVMAAVVCAAGAAWAGVRVYRRARSDFE
jgi:membrane protein DedA with SNARE-associated domain